MRFPCEFFFLSGLTGGTALLFPFRWLLFALGVFYSEMGLFWDFYLVLPARPDSFRHYSRYAATLDVGHASRQLSRIHLQPVDIL